MDWGSPWFVIAIITVVGVLSIIKNWVRARHGYELEDDWGGKSQAQKLKDDRSVQLLTSENESLKGQMSRLEERISVLERIATDDSPRLAREIESLREAGKAEAAK